MQVLVYESLSAYDDYVLDITVLACCFNVCILQTNHVVPREGAGMVAVQYFNSQNGMRVGFTTVVNIMTTFYFF